MGSICAAYCWHVLLPGEIQTVMRNPQSERDACYLTALAIFESLRRKGVISDSELVKIDSFLAEKFSASLAVKTPELACI